MELLIGVGIFFAFCWILGGLTQAKGQLGGLANIVYWIFRKGWLILAILLIVGIFIGF